MATDHDVVVIGAGFSGLYALHKFRNELGLSVQGLERAGGVGGTWWWNRYPGARCDFESVHYSYSFSPELQREWEWTERFAGQPEILAYLEWVAEKLDVRRSFEFNTSVTSQTWDEDAKRWLIETDAGESHTARFVISCVGGLSKPKENDFPGAESFAGELYWTSSWPHDKVDFTNKRVAVIGTGSSGIQVIQEIAASVGHLTVFQRTPNFVAPLGNAPVELAERRWNAENHVAVRADSRDRLIGAPYDRALPSALAVSADERAGVYDKYWERGGFPLIISTFADLLFSKEANDTLADYIRGRIHERVSDPTKAAMLSPTNHAYGTKRPPFESGYYEAFNRPNVDLVDVSEAPISAITPTGIQTADTSYDFDMIILATGFDAFTGAHLAIPTYGRDGESLKSAWSKGPKNYVGLAMAGFPNLFTIMGPLSASAQYNSPLLIEDNLDFVAAAVEELASRGANYIEPSVEAETKWTALVNDVLGMSLFANVTDAAHSWHMGDNIPGKPHSAYTFPVGAPLYRAICDQVQARGFAGFAIDQQPTELPPLVRLDPGAALVMAGMMNQGAPPMEACTPEMLRGMVDGLAAMQIPGPAVSVDELPEHHVRVYRPVGGNGLPVVIFMHGGGFVAGSLDSVDPTCRSLSARLDAVIVSVNYRLAPEHPFPAATDDVHAALEWVQQSIYAFGGDPHRIALMGESAGANLAAVASLRARDAGIPIAAQVLISPPFSPDGETSSLREFEDGPFLTAAASKKFWSLYLGGSEIGPWIDPGRAESLADLAPALVLTMELDPSRDGSEGYARALAEAGVSVTQKRFDGLFHGVLQMSAMVPRVGEIHDAVERFLSDAFDRTAQPA